MTIRDSQNLNFAISVNELSNLIYGTPLTFNEFYEKENDVFTKVKNYIIANGEYDYEDNDYTIRFGFAAINSTLSYQTGAIYDSSTDEITLTLFLTDGDSSTMVFIKIDTIDGIYEWSYIDGYNSFMLGNIYANTFNANTVLSYTYYSQISTSSLRTSIQELSSSMIRLLVKDINTDYSIIGITAYDFGFLYY